MPVKTAKKTKSSKKSTKKSKKKVEAPVEEVEEAPVEEVEEAPVEEAQPKRTRRVVDRESVVRDFDSLLQTLEDHVEELRSSSNNKTRKNTGVKFVKSVTKSLRTLKKDTVKAMKMKRKTNRAKNATSGFMKPVESLYSFFSLSVTVLNSNSTPSNSLTLS